MKKTLTLKRPIIINGIERTELSYDVEAITTDQYLKACSKAAESDRGMMSKLKQKENDYALHMYLGYEAIIACNPEIDYEDLKRASGFDVLSFTDIGWLFIITTPDHTLIFLLLARGSALPATIFIMRTPGAASKEDNSDVQSENSEELSTQESSSSEECD